MTLKDLSTIKNDNYQLLLIRYIYNMVIVIIVFETAEERFGPPIRIPEAVSDLSNPIVLRILVF